jgi:hypothetical protein
MEMWDWRSGDHRAGITDSERRAKAHVAEHLEPGETGCVLKVISSCGHSYSTGTGWQGTRTADGAVRWTSFPGGDRVVA